jgi:hypothetical protein
MRKRGIYNILTCYENQRATEDDIYERAVLEGTPSLLNVGPEDLYGNIHLKSVREQDSHRDGELYCLSQAGGKTVSHRFFKTSSLG